MNKIIIRDLTVSCVIGIFPHEREIKQEIVLNVTLHADIDDACASDSIEDTVDYKELKSNILGFVENSRFKLIEKLAFEVLKICLKTPKVQKAEITVDKPGALSSARSVAVELERSRDDIQS